MATHTTKTRILDAAEQLFAERGYGATSLRAVIDAAGVNQAAIHYHFGGRERLFGAVVDRRAWEPPPLFRVLVRAGNVPRDDAYRTFNMGIGYVLMVAADGSDRILVRLRDLGEEPVDIGAVAPTERRFSFQDV